MSLAQKHIKSDNCSSISKVPGIQGHSCKIIGGTKPLQVQASAALEAGGRACLGNACSLASSFTGRVDILGCVSMGGLANMSCFGQLGRWQHRTFALAGSGVQEILLGIIHCGWKGSSCNGGDDSGGRFFSLKTIGSDRIC